MMMRSAAAPPAARSAMKSSSVFTRPVRRCCASRSRRWRFCAISRAAPASAITLKVSPASGTPSKPRIWTGVEGPASVTVSPRSLYMARTRPENWPQMKSSPTRRVPFWTRIVATGPLPGSRVASSTVPRAAPAGRRRQGAVGAHARPTAVRHLGAAGPHRRKRRVPRRVEEGERPAALERFLVGPDVLRDAACLTRHDVGLADVIEQRRLAVVDVTHHRHDRRPRLERRLRVVGRLFAFADDVLLLPHRLEPEGGRDQLDHVEVEPL